jgi:hypothetical protein
VVAFRSFPNGSFQQQCSSPGKLHRLPARLARLGGGVRVLRHVGGERPQEPSHLRAQLPRLLLRAAVRHHRPVHQDRAADPHQLPRQERGRHGARRDKEVAVEEVHHQNVV